jgi:hypothetical protein
VWNSFLLTDKMEQPKKINLEDTNMVSERW